MVEASKESIKDTHVHNTSVGTTSDDSQELVSLDEGDLGLLAGEASPKA